jgi:Kdo2-lipid IVA lauroyltransferase/acyltransferase
MTQRRRKKRREKPDPYRHAWRRVPVELALRVMVFCTTCFGHRWAYWWARRIAWIGWTLMPRLRGVALRNVDLCLPDMPERERNRVARASYRHFCYQLMDYFLIPRYFKPDTWQKYFEGSGDDHPFYAWYAADEPGFNLTAHLGNFEVSTFNIGRTNPEPKLMLIARDVRPPLLDRLINRAREAMGNEVYKSRGGAKAYLRAKKERRKCGIVVDQNGGNFAPDETFFGVRCTWQEEWAKLALRAGGNVCVHFCVRDGERFKFKYLEPRFFDYPPDTEPNQLIRDYRDAIEAVVREHPEQYFWVHRRFKARKKGWPDRYEDLGKRLDAEQREQLALIPILESSSGVAD